MGLESHPVAVFFALLAVACVAGTVWAWPRLASGGALRIVGRLACVVSCQLMAVLLLLVLVNDYFGFYTSWSEVFGYGATDGVPPVVEQHSSKGGGRTEVPLALGRVVAVGDRRPGRLVDVTIGGGTSGISEAAKILLPPQYDEPSWRTTRFPAALVLAGYPGHISTLVRRLEVPRVMARLERLGTVRPMVLVLLSPTVAAPRDTECADVVGGPLVETFLDHDVPRWVAQHYRVTTAGRHWGAVGASTGGFCAAKLAMRHPGDFHAAVSLSGYLHALLDGSTGSLYGGDPALRPQSDLLWRVVHLPPPPVDLLLTASRSEHDVYAQVQGFLDQVRPPLQAASIIVPHGGHNFGVWVNELPSALQWLSARIA